MIIAHATDKETAEQLVILGLERENINRLIQGLPMRITQESHPGFPLQNVKIVVIFAETISELTKLVVPFMDPDTKIIDNRQKPGHA